MRCEPRIRDKAVSDPASLNDGAARSLGGLFFATASIFAASNGGRRFGLCDMRHFLGLHSPIAMSVGPVVGAQQEVTLTAADGVKISGTYYAAASKSAPIILLFHQAGSNRWEYAPIAPRLVKAGFSALAIDARHGGGDVGPWQ